MLKKLLFHTLYLFLLCFKITSAQAPQKTNRLLEIKTQLDSLSQSVSGLREKVDFNVRETPMVEFVQAMANLHRVNISLDNQLQQLQISNNFSDATVSDVLFYLCKNHSLTIDFTGNILSLKKYLPPKKPFVPKKILANYDPNRELLTLDLQQDTLAQVFKKITNLSGKNLVFTPGLGNRKLNGYFKELPLKTALEKLAFANHLAVHQSRDDIFLFEPNETIATAQVNQRPIRSRNSNFYYKIKDTLSNTLEVDFENTSIEAIIKNIGFDLNIDMFTNASLKEAGQASVKAHNISFDTLLFKILENTSFSYKKEGTFYFFGKKEHLSVRTNVIIPLQHRSIEMMRGVSLPNRSNPASQRNEWNNNYNNTTNTDTNRNSRQRLNTQNSQNFNNYNNAAEALVNMLPKDIIEALEIKSDVELNSFVVSGPAQNIQRFQEFISAIDKQIPVILIEVMFIEHAKNASIETGLEMGIGTEPTTTEGKIFPSSNLNLGAQTINKIIGGFNGFGSSNLGRVAPNFYASIKALENSGTIHVKSTPKLSTLNGHKASLAIGETTYFVITNRDFIGSQIPQTSTITNYQAIDAELALDIMPLVSGDGNITMSIQVIQSSFNGTRIAPDAPPDMNSRSFSSTIRVKDQDVIILGGLEENTSNDIGSGVPLLARIPVIKWFFSSRKKENSAKKLSILIKPTVIQ